VNLIHNKLGLAKVLTHKARLIQTFARLKQSVIQEKEMNTPFANQQKPTLVNVIAWMTLASGIVNLFWGLGLSLTVLLSIIGIVCVPLTILPTVLGIFEVIYAAKLLSNPPQAVQPSTNIAVLEIVCILAGNIFSVVVGILALIFYNDLTVKDYFARLNGTFAPVVPIPTPAPPPTTTTSEESAPTDETPSSDEDAPKG
jgi:hypothetical protein